MHTYLKQTLLTLFLLVSIPPLSYADFYVIPVVKKVNTLITVAKSGGEFNDIVAAIASVTDASADNPYVVYVSPGIYTVGLDQQIVIKDYVSLIAVESMPPPSLPEELYGRFDKQQLHHHDYKRLTNRPGRQCSGQWKQRI